MQNIMIVVFVFLSSIVFAQELTANTPATASGISLDQIVTYAGYLVAVLTALISLYKSHKAGQTLAQSLTVLANTLKDETKMVGGQFSTKTIEKAHEVAQTIGANDVAIQQVNDVLKGKEVDIKLGSWKGKPIYLSNALSFASIAQALGKLFRV